MNGVIEPKAKESYEWLEKAIKPNHGHYKAAIFKYTAKQTHFSYNPAFWEEHNINGTTLLMTKIPFAKPGNYISMPLGLPLIKGEKYTLKTRFKVIINSPLPNFHIKSAGESYYQVIYGHRITAENKNKWVEISTEFIPDSSIYDEFMFGAAQVCGEERGLYIEIDKRRVTMQN